MVQWYEWLSAHWTQVVYPLLAFAVTYSLGLWLRVILFRFFEGWKERSKWRASRILVDTIRRPFIDWFMLLGALIAVQISDLAPGYKDLASKIIGTLFIVSVSWVAIILVEKIIRLYSPNLKSPYPTPTLSINIVRVTVIVVAALIALDVWGAPVNPILLVLAVIVFVAGLALRDTIPSIFFGMQIASAHQIKVGDFIKLDSGESGQVTSITWQSTQIKALDGDSIIIPNSKLARTTVVNFGHPLKKSIDPFHFNTRLHLRELTGLKAGTLVELAAVLREVPDSVIYYHVHHFLEEHLYLTPEPANDFAIWVSNAVGNDMLGERLASIEPFGFPTLGALKQRIIEVLEDYNHSNPDSKRVPDGEEFHFIRSISFILPTPYVAHDLREFVEILRKVTFDSIYFHIFEARLRLQKGTNDFSIWIADSLGEKELADKIGNIDPYVYTLENLRSKIIEFIEPYIR